MVTVTVQFKSFLKIFWENHPRWIKHMVWLHQSNCFHQKTPTNLKQISWPKKTNKFHKFPAFLRFNPMASAEQLPLRSKWTSTFASLGKELGLDLLNWQILVGWSPKWGFQSNHWNKNTKPTWTNTFIFFVALGIQISNSVWDLNCWTLIKPCDVRFYISQQDEPKGPTCLDECECFDEAEFHGRPHMVQMRASKIPTISVASVVQVPDEFMRSLYTYDTTRLHYMYSTYIYTYTYMIDIYIHMIDIYIYT